MRSLTAFELLDVWERGQSQDSLRRALLLLAAAQEECSIGEIAEWSIGERNAALLELRERVFGSRLTSRASCQQCGVDLEIDQDTRAFRSVSVQPTSTAHFLRLNGYQLAYRLPNTNDLLAVSNAPDAASAQAVLIERLLLSQETSPNKTVLAQHMSELAVTLDNAISQADPLAVIQFALSCPQCEHKWNAVLDIAEFFWKEIHAWALRILREIHTIASVYGWTETDILALSPQRRHAYLELIGA